jgi:hypothetical protein
LLRLLGPPGEVLGKASLIQMASQDRGPTAYGLAISTADSARRRPVAVFIVEAPFDRTAAEVLRASEPGHGLQQ